MENWRGNWEVHVTEREEGGMYGNDEGASRTDYFCVVCMAK